MHLHILGICGTFMGGVAGLARESGHRVTGSDQGIYPPMSDALAELGIEIMPGYDPRHLQPAPDYVLIGNALSRGNPTVEYVLDNKIPYTSGPAWLSENVLHDRWVLAVAGTHGKTTGASLLSWILDQAGHDPGFLIGGIPKDFGVSARLGTGPHFVVEADEYDTAFFDKRSKFLHYRPKTLVLNNLEFDHADIFDDLDAIKTQFHHLIRTIPANGRIIVNARDDHLVDVLSRGCWSETEEFSIQSGVAYPWLAAAGSSNSRFEVLHNGLAAGRVEWGLTGSHNIENGLAAIAAAYHAGVEAAHAAESLRNFSGIRRRLEVRGVTGGVTVYDDFAHHPTEIGSTLAAMREIAGPDRVIAVLEPRSHTMKLGVHRSRLPDALNAAARVFIYRPEGLQWDPAETVAGLGNKAVVTDSTDDLLAALVAEVTAGDHVVIMSNGSFDGIHDRLLKTLAALTATESATGR